MSTYYQGNEQILYFVIDGSDIPVGCLTSNSFNETAEFIETTTADNKGWKTSRPTNQSYTMSFEGLQVLTPDNPEKLSYDYLKVLKRNRTLISWKLMVDGIFEDTGQAYIQDIGEVSQVGEYMSFNVSMVGYGQPTKVNVDYTVLRFMNNNSIEYNDNDLKIAVDG